jgi:hypothetical protein
VDQGFIEFSAILRRPAKRAPDETWTFLRLPIEASERLPARSMVSVEGDFNGYPLQATLEPDGEGGHWLRVEAELSDAAGVKAGQAVALRIAPMTTEPEPKVPDDLQSALAANSAAFATWQDITAVSRRDWVAWVTSGKKAETRIKRIEVACDKLASGKRRACCFDRSGMYSKSLSCPVAAAD